MLTNIGARLRRWRRRLSRAEWETRHLRLTRDTTGSHAPGLLLIQIDGLARAQLEHALASGRMPFLRRLLRRDGCRLRTFYSGLPATTPAVQAELHYGVRGAVPAFSFLDPRADDIGVMMHPDWAKRIEADLARRGEGLLKGGSSWSNIYTGGASQEESHFCGASISPADMWRTGKLTNILLFAFLHLPSFLRLLALLPVELVLSCVDAVRGMLRGRSVVRELVFILARVFVCVGLRELVTLGAKVDLARGLPVIHVNFLGYDEQSHRRGPGSRFAHWTLRGIDRAILHLHRAARRSEGRDYEVWIFSDHGQIHARPFGHVAPGGLEGVLRRRWPGLPDQERNQKSDTRGRQRHAPLPAFTRRGAQRRADRLLDHAALNAFERREFAVACMGPVGHVYFKRPLTRADEDRLVDDLLADGVPAVLLKRDGRVLWRTAETTAALPDAGDLIAGPAELRPVIARDLMRLVHGPFAGNLVCLGWKSDGTSLSFAEENGAHCGPSDRETQGLLILPPASSHLLPGDIVRPAELRAAALAHLGRSPRPAHRRRAPRKPAHLRVVTYNVHYCKGLDGRFAPDRIARVLRELDPDIVALQELDCGRSRSRGEDQLAYLAAELGLNHAFCPSIEIGGERYGHGLLSRGEIDVRGQIHLPDGGVPVIEPRDALHAATEIDGRDIMLVGTHLGLAYRERAAQIDRLLQPDLLGGGEGGPPSIFLGDLNLAPGGRLYRRLVSRWDLPDGDPLFRNVQAHAPGHVAVKTFPSFLPLRQLDHIFVSPHFAIHRVQSPANLLTRRASDHLPLAADLELHE
ncbi:MAG: endonuclease/exonuclease/phosphatase family protein [Verrucomicrobiota bacterium]